MSASARTIIATKGFWDVPRPEKKTKVEENKEKDVISCSSYECDSEYNNYLFKFTKRNPKQKLQELIDKLDDLPEKVKAESYNCFKFDANNKIYWEDVDKYYRSDLLLYR